MTIAERDGGSGIGGCHDGTGSPMSPHSAHERIPMPRSNTPFRPMEMEMTGHGSYGSPIHRDHSKLRDGDHFYGLGAFSDAPVSQNQGMVTRLDPGSLTVKRDSKGGFCILHNRSTGLGKRERSHSVQLPEQLPFQEPERAQRGWATQQSCSIIKAARPVTLVGRGVNKCKQIISKVRKEMQKLENTVPWDGVLEGWRRRRTEWAVTLAAAGGIADLAKHLSEFHRHLKMCIECFNGPTTMPPLSCQPQWSEHIASCKSDEYYPVLSQMWEIFCQDVGDWLKERELEAGAMMDGANDLGVWPPLDIPMEQPEVVNDGLDELWALDWDNRSPQPLCNDAFLQVPLQNVLENKETAVSLVKDALDRERSQAIRMRSCGDSDRATDGGNMPATVSQPSGDSGSYSKCRKISQGVAKEHPGAKDSLGAASCRATGSASSSDARANEHSDATDLRDFAVNERNAKEEPVAS